jgi:hypothetical protein
VSKLLDAQESTDKVSKEREGSPVEYLPPEREGIDTYAKHLCEHLADKYDDPSYREGDVVHGLAVLQMGIVENSR